MKHIISLAVFLSIISLCCRAQIGGDFNPENPSDPGTPVQKYTLSLKALPTDGGNFNSNVTKVAAGEQYNLRAYPNSDFRFVAWVCEGDTLSKLASYTYTMPAHNVEIAGVFTYDPSNPADPEEQALRYQLSLKADPINSGSFNLSNERVAVGSTTSLRAYASTDYVFRQWMIGDSVLSTDSEMRFEMPAHNVSITGKFEYNPTNPANPGANYWNPVTGEVIVDDFTPGRLYDAIYYAISGSNSDDVAMITVAGRITGNDFGIANNYRNCTLLDFSRVTGVTEIPSYAFDYTNLESVYLPATIEKIGNRAFAECPALSSLTIYAMTPPVLGGNVFQGVPEGLVVYVPAAAIAQYQDAEGWKDFTLLPIQEDIRSITVNLPAGTDPSGFTGMWLELINTKNGQRMHFVMTDRMQYVFPNIVKNTAWNVTLRNERGDVFGRIDNIELKDEDVAVTFAALSKPQNVSIAVVTPCGLDVTDRTRITWTDDQGNYLAQSESLTGLPEGFVATYAVALSQDEAMQYISLQSTQYVVKAGDNNIVCQLEGIKETQISGKVKDASSSLPLSGVTVSASQTFAGKYSKTLSTKTDKKGEYTLPIANVPTSVTFAAADYVSNAMVCDSLLNGEASVTLPDVALKEISGATISVAFTYTYVNGDWQEWFNDYQNVDFVVFNQTKGNALTQYNVQLPQIILLEEVEDGDMLRLTASSRSNAFMPVETTAVIDGQKASAIFDIVELGQIQASVAKTGNSALVGSLYDDAGKLVKTYNYSNASLKIPDLADGKYSLVSMGSSRMFNSIYDLEQLPQTGLTEGSDYVLSNIDVKSGCISEVEIDEVPSLDESKLYYTGDNTSFTVNKPSIVAGNYLTLTGRIDFKPSYAPNVSNVQLIVDLPESCEFVDNSVMVGNNTSSYTINGNRITIPLARYTDRVRFCIIPTLGGEYAPSAFTQFDLDDKTVTQPIGSANYTAENLSISVPSTVAKTTIPVSGTAIGKSDIEIYDNGVLIGQTTSLANGSWSTTCELNEPYNLSTHEIFASILTKQGLELKTETEECKYDMMAVEPKSVTMSFYNGWLRKNVEVVFDYSTNSTSASSYMFYTTTDVTFVVDFTNNDSTSVSNVEVIVRTDKGNDIRLPAVYDCNLCRWIAVKNFGSYELPVNVNVDYVSAVNYIGDRDYLDSKLSSISSGIDDQKEEIVVLENLLDVNNIEQENLDIYNSIETILSGHDYDLEDMLPLLYAFVEGIYDVDDSVQIDDTDNMDTLESEFQQWFTEYKNLSVDSLLAEFSIPSYIQEFEIPSVPYSCSASLNNDICMYDTELISDYNEQKLIEDGFLLLDATDGSKVLYKITPSLIIFIDTSKMVKYSFSYMNDATLSSQKTVNVDLDDFIDDSALPFTNCLEAAVDVMKMASDGGDKWYEQAERLNSVLKSIQCFYETAMTWTDEKLQNALKGKIKNTEDLISLRNTELDKCKTNISVHVKEMKAIDARNIEIDRLVELYKGSPDYAEDIRLLLAEKSANKVLRDGLDLKILKETQKIVTLKVEIKALNSALKAFKKAYDIVFKPFSKLPKSLSRCTKLTQVTKLTGKLIGGFGVFLETIAFYNDLCDALDVLERWVWLKKAIDMKMPCEGDRAKALQLQDDINKNGNLLYVCCSSVLWAELQAIKIDAASLAMMELPPAELALWFASGVFNIYAEWAKYLAIDGRFLDLETEYWQEIGHLKCKKDPDDSDDNDGNNKKNPKNRWPFDPVSPIHDPSGYVYEGVASNRLEGVTATCFYKEEVEDMYGDIHENVVKWDAEEYAQKNPLFTDENGMYAWDVPQGLWQVKFEKDGYETTHSEWLPVPPPQLEVNIAMKQNRQPVVKSARAYEDAVEVEFDKYMMPELLTADNIFVMQNGVALEGAVELLNDEAATEGSTEHFASKVRFNAAKPFEAEEVTLWVNNRVKSYAGTRMQDDYQQTFAVEQEIRRMICDSTLTVGYGEQGSIIVTVLPASASKGKVLNVKTSSPMILSVDTESVIIGENGLAEVLVSGELPGTAALTYSIEGIDKTAMSIVNVKQVVSNTVANPTASIASGSVVDKGTVITLSCATERATIYYTLDGSCPCDITDSRKVYDGTPIVINDNTTIKAMAVAEGMYDSDVVEFNYFVDGSGIADITSGPMIEIYPLPVRDKLNISAGGEIIKQVLVTSANGMLVGISHKEKAEVTIDVRDIPAGIYIVNVTTDSGVFIRKVQKVK